MGTKILTPVAISSSTGQHHSALSAGGEGAVWVDNRKDAWIQYDLGGPIKVGKVAIGFDYGVGNEKTKYMFSINTSVDGLGYTPAITNKPSLVPGKVKASIYAFKPRLARYVRLVIHGNNSVEPTRAGVDSFEVMQGGGTSAVKPKAKKSKVKKTIKKSKSRRR